MRKIVIGVVMVLMLVAITLPAIAKDKNKTIESFRANAIMQTRGGGSMAEINIYRWTTDEERAELLEAVKEASADRRRNSRRVAQALRGQQKTGFAFLAGRQGYPLRYARQFDMGDGKRQIILATDRPVSFGEVYNQSQLGDFDVSLIVLNLDKDGRGEGVWSVGTEILWNDREQKLEITNTTSQPVKLGDVRPN